MTSDLRELLEFAAEEQPLYFAPTTQVEVLIEDDEGDQEWRPIYATRYSFDGLIGALATGAISVDDVRFVKDTVEEYLSLLRSKGFADELHAEDAMDMERGVAFMKAGYTEPEDFLASADPIDIGQETSVDRDIVTEIATNYVGGFSSGRSFGDSGLLAHLEPRDNFEGWKLVRSSANQIRWVSNGRFNVTIEPAPSGGSTVTYNMPEVKQHAWYRKGRTIEIPAEDAIEPTAALKRAHDWLTEQQLEFEDDLAELPYIGAATKDYLALQYNITSIDGVRELSETQPDEFDAIFGEHGTELRDALFDEE